MIIPKTHPQPCFNPSKKPISKTLIPESVFQSLIEANLLMNRFAPYNLYANVHKKSTPGLIRIRLPDIIQELRNGIKCDLFKGPVKGVFIKFKFFSQNPQCA
jgi:hypothetical protein